ncbi:hypothetical protein [Sphingobium sp.]|uniref:hypothetical protein n=1 Tax=Sphingobium sp. TaxID=1912891 RepID=UPI002C8F5DA6|nr:hypothetical protein [Sphingobium sp.]HUD95407.1 hypothetical protein [Sphingobium sp.]
MDATFNFLVDVRRNLMRVNMAGFFSEDDVQRFANEYRSNLSKLNAPGHLTLVDIKQMKIQAQSVVNGFSSLLASPDVRSRRLAFICSSTLARLQAQRLTDREDVEFFDDEAKAERWLTD